MNVRAAGHVGGTRLGSDSRMGERKPPRITIMGGGWEEAIAV